MTEPVSQAFQSNVARATEVVNSLLTEYGAEGATPDQQLDSLDLDSLDRLELSLMIEDELDVVFNDDAVKAWVTVDDVIQACAKQLTAP